jgi:hypothetical protein
MAERKFKVVLCGGPALTVGVALRWRPVRSS